MKLLAYGPIAAATIFLAADATPGVSSFLPPEIVQGSALAVLGWTIYYVLARVFPAHQRAQKEQRDAFLKFLADRLDDRAD